ncbi:DinB family protein [Larkinella sp. VNQ87]|uniref:DinB family protein n=1 Tax=Larkinella sp. VNQ87 TaxID=3400921 RepID=UPI003BFB5AE6
MSLKSASTDILMQLADAIGQLTNEAYARPLAVLSGNTVGKHVRHILEFYELLIDCAPTGRLNYDHRKRDLRLEVDTHEALRRIGALDRAVHLLDLSRPLALQAELSVVAEKPVQIPSTFARELLYNIEHAIHHMALIQVAVRTSFPQVVLPPQFGVAYSTLQYQSHES